MDVFAWSSYSCNNSSDYRLIATFSSASAAEAMRAELAAFFAAHAKEHDRQARAADFDWPGAPTAVARALGAKYGHAWRESLVWGEEQLAGDEPEVGVVGESVVLYHGYSSGGFGPDVPRVLQRAGATLVEKCAVAGPPVLHAALGLAPGGALERGLVALFAQRPAALRDWKRPAWLPEPLVGNAGDVAFAVDAGRCTFTLPLVAANIEPLRRYLERGGATELALRLASKQDVAQTRKREAAQPRAAPPVVAEQKAARPAKGAKLPKAGPIAARELFRDDKKLGGAQDLVVADGAIIAFAGDEDRTQRLVTTDGKRRTVTNLAQPRGWLQGVCVDADGTWRAGGPKRTIFASTDRGATWKPEKHPSLAKAIGDGRISAVCRFGAELWVAGEGGVARQVGATWQKVALPARLQPAQGDDPQHPPSLVVTDGALFVLCRGIARWDGKKLAIELASDHAVRCMTTTAAGTRLAAGTSKESKAGYVLVDRTVWRKPRGGTWTLIGEQALVVPPVSADLKARDVSYSEAYLGLVAIDRGVVLVAEDQAPQRQGLAVRVSEDDGKTFRPLKVAYGTYTGAVADGRGGALVAGTGGKLVRVARDGGAWKSQ